MSRTQEHVRARWIFLAAFALVMYSTGAAFIEGFVNYSSWHLIGPDHFVAYHEFIGPRVVALLVVPVLLGTVCTIFMLWWRPRLVPAWAVWAALAAQAVMWVSTVTIQIPLQTQLRAQGASVTLLERLIETNFWLRRLPYGICAGLFLWMAAQTMRVSQMGPGHDAERHAPIDDASTPDRRSGLPRPGDA